MTTMFILFLIGVVMMLILISIVIKPSLRLKHDIDKLDQAYDEIDVQDFFEKDWLNKSEYESLNMIKSSHPESLERVEKAFKEFHALLSKWDRLFDEHKEALAHEDATKLFRVKMQEIKRICGEYASDRFTKNRFETELDYQIDSLTELLRTLARVAQLRDLAMP